MGGGSGKGTHVSAFLTFHSGDYDGSKGSAFT